jgi:hypothetical protein
MGCELRIPVTLKKQMHKALIQISSFCAFAPEDRIASAFALRASAEAIQEPRKQMLVSFMRVGPTGPAFWSAR